jgi:hypothetical protein
MFALRGFCENYRSSANNRATFFNSKNCVLNVTKMDWATFWATFSQTRLVTLDPSFGILSDYS